MLSKHSVIIFCSIPLSFSIRLIESNSVQHLASSIYLDLTIDSDVVIYSLLCHAI